MITTLNNHVHIKPIKREGVVVSHEKDYDEKGIVVAWGNLIPPFKAGSVVYFDSWMAAKFEKDTPEEFWLIPYEAIRAYE